MKLNEKIIAARKAAKKSQEKVAREIDVTVRAYQKYEYGTSKPSDPRALEKALNVPIGTFHEPIFSEEEQMEYIKTTVHALMADGKLSEVDKDAFLQEMFDIMEDAKQRKAAQAEKEKKE